MTMRFLTLAFAIGFFAQPAWAADLAINVGKVPDVDLEQVRGKFLLPNGIEVAMTVQTDTSINGQLLLRSVFTVDQGAPNLAVYSPAGTTSASAQSSTGNGGGASAPGVWVSFDRESGITMVRPAYVATPTSVNVGTGNSADIGKSPDGSTPLMLSPDGAPVVTGNGQVSLDRLPDGSRVTLSRPDFEVSHIVGQAFGSVLANTANNRTIDTSTTIDLDLSNATPNLVGSAMPRVEGLALDVARDLVR